MTAARSLEGPASIDEPATAILREADVSGEDATRTFDPGNNNLRAKQVRMQRLILGVAAAVVVVAVLGWLGYRYYGGSKMRQIESIAVMPFVNESGNPEVEYLSDGMTETLIASLLQLPDINVKARSSVFRYKGKDTNPQTVGKELNVQAILNGRVIQRGQDLILNVELIDVETENALWTENYTRKMSNLVSLQNEIARDLSQKLKTKLSGTDEQKLAKNYTENAEAYRLYLLGKSYWNKRGPKNIEIAIGYYQQAINLDANFALAFAGLAEAYAQPSQQPPGMAKARCGGSEGPRAGRRLSRSSCRLCKGTVRPRL